MNKGKFTHYFNNNSRLTKKKHLYHYQRKWIFFLSCAQIKKTQL